MTARSLRLRRRLNRRRCFHPRYVAWILTRELRMKSRALRWRTRDSQPLAMRWICVAALVLRRYVCHAQSLRYLR